LSGWSLPVGGYRLSFALASACCVTSCVLARVSLKGVRTSKIAHSERQSLRTEVLSRKPVLYLMGVYILHSWEILGMWAWTPAFLAANLALRGFDGLSAAGFGSYATAAFHVSGLMACSFMGGLSDRLGRGHVIMLGSGLSALCSFGFGWSMGLPFMLVLAIGLVYSFFAIGDSPVLSVAMTEVTPAPFLGRAFGLRSLVGFGAGAVSPIVFGAVLDWVGSPGSGAAPQAAWGWAFGTLGLAGFGAFWVSLRLNRVLGSVSRPLR
jgi:MFS family permease